MKKLKKHNKKIERTHNLSILDISNGIKTSAEITDTTGTPIDLGHVIKAILEYIQEESNKIQTGAQSPLMDQVLTLLCHIMNIAIPSIAGEIYAETLLGTGHGRYTVTMSMLMGFLVAQYLQETGNQITLYNEKLSNDEKEFFHELNIVQEATTLGMTHGILPVKVIQQLIQQGKIKNQQLIKQLKDDLEDISTENNLDEDSNEQPFEIPEEEDQEDEE